MPRGSNSVATAWRRGSGGGGLLIEPLQRVAPPGQPDRAKRRLGRGGDDIGQGIVDVEQGVEGGPQLDRPVEPDEIAVPQSSLSDRGPPWPP